MKVKRGEVYLADLSDASGSEQGKVRPVVIIQNDRGNNIVQQPLLLVCLPKSIQNIIYQHTIYYQKVLD